MLRCLSPFSPYPYAPANIDDLYWHYPAVSYSNKQELLSRVNTINPLFNVNKSLNLKPFIFASKPQRDYRGREAT